MPGFPSALLRSKKSTDSASTLVHPLAKKDLSDEHTGRASQSADCESKAEEKLGEREAGEEKRQDEEEEKEGGEEGSSDSSDDDERIRSSSSNRRSNSGGSSSWIADPREHLAKLDHSDNRAIDLRLGPCRPGPCQPGAILSLTAVSGRFCHPKFVVIARKVSMNRRGQ